MSVGHHHEDAPAPVGTVIRALQLNAGLRGALGGYVSVNRSYRVPYLAGASQDCGTVYIDSQTPERLPKSGVEPDETFPPHEVAEWWLMTALGWDYLRAHRLAHGIEQYRMRLSGVSDERIEQYEAECRALVNLDEHAKLPPEAFPPDLYLGPYESDPDALDGKLLPLLRAAQHLGERVSKETVDYGPGHPDAHCGICRYFLPPHACARVEGRIDPAMWCRLFEAKAKQQGDEYAA